MKTYSRREFISAGAMGTLAAMYLKPDLLTPGSLPFNWTLSFQSYGLSNLSPSIKECSMVAVEEFKIH